MRKYSEVNAGLWSQVEQPSLNEAVHLGADVGCWKLQPNEEALGFLGYAPLDWIDAPSIGRGLVLSGITALDSI